MLLIQPRDSVPEGLHPIQTSPTTQPSHSIDVPTPVSEIVEDLKEDEVKEEEQNEYAVALLVPSLHAPLFRQPHNHRITFNIFGLAFPSRLCP